MLWFLPQRFSCNDNDILKSESYSTKLVAQKQRQYYDLLMRWFSNYFLVFFKNKIEVIEGILLYLYLWVQSSDWMGAQERPRDGRQHQVCSHNTPPLSRTLLTERDFFLEELRISRGNEASIWYFSSLKIWEMRGGNDAAYGHTLSMKSLASYNLIVNNRGVRCSRNNPPPTPTPHLHPNLKYILVAKTKSEIRNSLFSAHILKTRPQNTFCRGNVWIICLMCWMLQQNVGEREEMFCLPPVSKRMHDLYDANNQRTLSQYSLSAPQVL